MGNLNHAAAESLTSALAPVWEEPRTLLEVDLSGVVSSDRDGLRPLIEAHARLLERMRLFAPSYPVAALLDTLGLGGMFTVVGPWPRLPALEARPSRDARPSTDEHQHGWGPDEPSLPTPRSLSDRASIEQAKGLLMGAEGCSAQTAWDVLRETAMAHQVPIRVMARRLLTQASNGLSPTSWTVTDDVLGEVSRSHPVAPEGAVAPGRSR